MGARGSGAATASAPGWDEVADEVFVRARKDSSRLAVSLNAEECRPACALYLPMFYILARMSLQIRVGPVS